jgi:molybdate transport system substrate-binding protein
MRAAWRILTGRALGLVTLLAVVGMAPLNAHAEDAPAIAAAADLKFALEEVARNFRRDTGLAVTLVFGSSGNFTRQIQAGAPFQLFMSADEGFIITLAEKGYARDKGVLYAIGRLVLFAPAGSPLTGKLTATGLRDAVSAGRITHFAIANPEHAPYGRAAQQWLETNGLWQSMRPLLVLGDNVQQAARFATLGESEGGIIAYSLALAPEISGHGTWALLSAKDHQLLRQRMALLKGAGATAERFYGYVQEPATRQVMKRYGFEPPGP